MKVKSQRFIAALAAFIVAGAATAAGEHGGHGAQEEKESLLGEPGKAAQVSRTVMVDMADTMRFKPEMIDVQQGETIRFVVKNSGRLKHEMVLGTPKELKQHYAMMMKMPEMEHAEDNMVTVEPGKTGEIIWRFSRARVVDFGCLQPGHYGAGMKGQVRVTRSSNEAAPATGSVEMKARKPSGHAGH